MRQIRTRSDTFRRLADLARLSEQLQGPSPAVAVHHPLREATPSLLGSHLEVSMIRYPGSCCAPRTVFDSGVRNASERLARVIGVRSPTGDQCGRTEIGDRHLA